MAAIYGQLGRKPEARAAVEHLYALRPDFEARRDFGIFFPVGGRCSNSSSKAYCRRGEGRRREYNVQHVLQLAEVIAMPTAIRAVYEGGVFKPKEPVELEERTEVEVLIPTAAQPQDDDPTGWKTADALIGCIEGGPKEPVGEEHDTHLYRR